jgi:hypothetical protein
MANEASEKAKNLAWTAIRLGILLICISLFGEPPLLKQPQCDPTAHPIIRELVTKVLDLIGKIGDACLIGGVIGIVIDQGLKTQFIQEVVRAASPKLLGQHLPDPLREILLNYFKISFIRPAWDIEYEITTVEGFPNFVKVSSRIQGIVQNCGSKTEEFHMSCTLDPSPSEPGEALITRISMQPESGTGGLDDFNPDNRNLVQPDGSKLDEKVLLIPPGARYKTILETIEYHPTSTVVPLFAGTTVIKSTVKIRYPKDLLEVQVATSMDTSFKPEVSKWGAEWEIPSVILPRQCIVATWNPKANTAKSKNSDIERA